MQLGGEIGHIQVERQAKTILPEGDFERRYFDIFITSRLLFLYVTILWI